MNRPDLDEIRCEELARLARRLIEAYGPPDFDIEQPNWLPENMEGHVHSTSEIHHEIAAHRSSCAVCLEIERRFRATKNTREASSR